MEWLALFEEEIEVEAELDEISLNFRISEFKPKVNNKIVFSLLTEFFLMLSNQDKNGQTSIFVDQNIDNQLIDEVILHFNSTRVVYEDDLPTEVMLSNPKEESLSEIQKQGINPIISDLFGKISEDPYEWSPSTCYKIIPEYIEKYEDHEFDMVIEGISRTSKDKHLVSFSTVSMNLEESLRDSIAIRYLAHKCKNVYLWVDKVGKITMIQIEI